MALNAANVVAQDIQRASDALGDASASIAAFGAAGGPVAAQLQAELLPVMQVLQQLQQSVQQLQQGQQQLQQGQQQLQQSVQQLQQGQQQILLLSSRAWNGTCGTGERQAYAPVPNAQGQLPPANLPAVVSLEVLRALTPQQLTEYCQHYGRAAPQPLEKRRRLVAAELNLKLVDGALE